MRIKLSKIQIDVVRSVLSTQKRNLGSKLYDVLYRFLKRWKTEMNAKTVKTMKKYLELTEHQEEDIQIYDMLERKKNR